MTDSDLPFRGTGLNPAPASNDPSGTVTERCPVTALPLTLKPAWTDVELGKGYFATFAVIGDSILLSRPAGNAYYSGIEHFMAMRSNVIREAFDKNQFFAEIKDYSHTRIPSRNTRRLFYNRMKHYEERTAAFIGFNASPMIRVSFNVGKRIVRLNFPVEIVPDYAQAVTMAVSAIEEARKSGNAPPITFFPPCCPKPHRSRTYSAEQMDGYMDDLLTYLVNISWDIDGVDLSASHIPPDHPFELVFEAFSLIKSDLDMLAHERKNAEADAVKSRDDLKAAHSRLLQSEKMASLGNLVAGVSHEISTPLGIGVTASTFLRDRTKAMIAKNEAGRLSNDDIPRFLAMAMESSAMITDNLTRAADLINSFKQISVDQCHEMKRIYNLKDYTESVLQSLAPRFKRTSYTMTLDCEEQIMVDSYPGVLSQILTNLVMNSFIHGFEGREKGGITLRMWTTADRIYMEFKDNGNGMDETTVRHAFDPFFTTRRSAGGTGLGLHIVFNLVTVKLKGDITCSSTPGEGATFLIHFPH